MQILDVVKLEDCLDGSTICRYRFESAWRRESILDLQQLGELQYFPTFPRPYFRLRSPQGLVAQGVEGESSCRVLFPRHGQDEVRRGWESMFAASSA